MWDDSSSSVDVGVDPGARAGASRNPVPLFPEIMIGLTCASIPLMIPTDAAAPAITAWRDLWTGDAMAIARERACMSDPGWPCNPRADKTMS